MLRLKLLGAGLIAGAVSFSAGPGYADESEFSAHLTGFNEIGSIPTTTPAAGSPTGYTGAILSSGSGKGSLQVNKNSIDYTLMYSDVGTTSPNTGTVTQAHIHFGKSRDSGGIMVFFCSNLGNGPAGTPKCPPNSGTVAGTWTAASVVGPAAQNIAAGNFAGLVDALNSNTAYANVHTTFYTAGEIRGQVHRVEQENQGNQGNQ